MPLFESRGIAIAHPDIATSGGILETKKIGDLAEDYGIAMATAHGRNAYRRDGKRPLRRSDIQLSWCWRTTLLTTRGGMRW